MNTLSRRNFIKGSLAAAAGVSAISTTSQPVWSRTVGANDRIRLGIIGVRGKGSHHVELFTKIKESHNCDVAAVCDVDTAIIDALFEKHYKDAAVKPKVYHDYRDMLAAKAIDAVVISTPNHWHSLMAIQACQAGKDVYCEKPVCHNIWEGLQMLKAVDKYKRIVQSGTQSRSNEGLVEAFEYLRSGNLGRIKLIRGFCNKKRDGIGKVTGPQPIQDTMDFNLWTGPARFEPLRRSRVHYNWHWDWNTGNGDSCNQGIHEMDQCRWLGGYDKLPERVISIGGRLGWDDDGQTPNTQITIIDYKPAQIIFETRNLPYSSKINASARYRGVEIGLIVECEGGDLLYSGGGWICDKKGRKTGKKFEERGLDKHVANFIEVMRSRKRSDLRADIVEGFLSSSLCHLGNIAHRLGQKTPTEKIKEAIGDNTHAMDSLTRLEKHLAANEVDLAKTPLTLGAKLKFDTDKYRFISGADENEYGITRWANELLTRRYRKGFVVPEKV